MSRQEARRLNVEPGSAGMQILRRYFAIDSQVVLVSTTVYPAGRYSFSIAMKLPRGAWSRSATRDDAATLVRSTSGNVAVVPF